MPRPLRPPAIPALRPRRPAALGGYVTQDRLKLAAQIFGDCFGPRHAGGLSRNIIRPEVAARGNVDTTPRPPAWCAMCNLFHHTTSAEAMRHLFDGMANEAGNIRIRGSLSRPNRANPDCWRRRARLTQGALGLPSPPQFHSPSGIDRGVTKVRNVDSPHWRRWLSAANRCLVPVDRFAEPRAGGRGAGNA